MEQTETAYDAAGLATSNTDGRGVITTTSYNAAAQTTVTTADANTSTPEITQDFYDAAGNETGSIDPVGNKTVDVYNADDEVASTATYDIHNIAVSSDAYSYDPNGDVLTTKDGDNNVTAETYNAQGQMLTIKSRDYASG